VLSGLTVPEAAYTNPDLGGGGTGGLAAAFRKALDESGARVTVDLFYEGEKRGETTVKLKRAGNQSVRLAAGIA